MGKSALELSQVERLNDPQPLASSLASYLPLLPALFLSLP